MKPLLIARASVLRIVRDRTSLFFILVLPILVIIIIGATVRGFSTIRVGVTNLDDGPAGTQLVGALRHASNLQVISYTSVQKLKNEVALGDVNTGVIIPKGLDAAEHRGSYARIDVLAEQANSTQQAAATAVMAVVLQQGSLVQAASFATAHATGTFDQNLARAETLARTVPLVGFTQIEAQKDVSVLPQGFSYSAPTELVLFVFLSALGAGAAMIETRKLGMYERMSAAPVRARTIIAGEAITYFTIALAQSILIVLVGLVCFGVSWGNPLAAAALVCVFAAVGAGAGMVAGTLFRTPEQASAIAPTVGIGLAMLGGCMWPLSIVSPTMRAIGHATPQAWAVDAWTSLLSRHGTLVSIGPQLGVLGAFACAFLFVAVVRLRRVLR